MRYDAIVIGSGQAGPGIASTFAGEGQRVALIEGDKLGGTCLNYGCRPTKTLRASAQIAHRARRAAEYGVQVGEVTVNFAQVMARKNRIIGEMQGSFRERITHVDGVDVYRAYGQFVGTRDGVHQVQVGDQVLEAERVYINVGARAFIPPIQGIEDVPYITNVEILDLPELPRHLLIIGGGYIGLEFGQMFRRFGSEVTIVESNPHLLSNEDEDVSEAVEALFRDEDIALYTNHKAVATSTQADGSIQLTIQSNESGEQRTLTGSHLLLAVGRTPNSDTLNVGAVGLETDKRGYIPVNGKFETNVPGIWAVGDVNGRGAFTHTSYQDYEILIANHKGEDRTVDNRIMAYAVFIDPPLGRVGMNEREARDSGRNVLMAVYQMADVSRARLDSDTVGLIKILVDADTEEIIGALSFGLHGDEFIQIISNFMHTGASYKVMQNALPVHPTVAEFLPTILGALKPLQ
ncbi:MAG: FAD-containing oxidoreductase [Anaerolineae bacterium]